MGGPKNVLVNLTLDQALELAEQLQPILAEARALVSAAEGRGQQAGLFPNPEVVARMESAPIQNRTLERAEYPLGLSQTIPLAGRLSKAKQVEQLERERLIHQAEAKRREIRKQVQSAFASSLYLDLADRIQRDLVASAEKLAGLSRARVAAGDALPEDLARAEMELARAKIELQRTGSFRQQGLAALAAAIGDASLGIAALQGSLEAAFELPVLESVAGDLERHPSVAASNADIAVRAARVDLAKAERIPNLNVDLFYRRLEAERADSFDIGFRVPLPLFDRGQGRLRSARAELEAAEARARSTRSDLSADFREARAALTSALAQARALKTEILPRAETLLRTAETRHGAGDLSLAGVLVARRDWANVRFSYLESLRDAMLAWANLNPFLLSTPHASRVPSRP
ncbi:MAG: TolC family protein [Verrucomicrobia bacterium]|nr:TolC family protein [Verrucomicrobiota bacterium]